MTEEWFARADSLHWRLREVRAKRWGRFKLLASELKVAGVAHHRATDSLYWEWSQYLTDKGEDSCSMALTPVPIENPNLELGERIWRFERRHRQINDAMTLLRRKMELWLIERANAEPGERMLLQVNLKTYAVAAGTVELFAFCARTVRLPDHGYWCHAPRVYYTGGDKP